MPPTPVRRDLGGLVVGVVIIGIGLLFLLDRVVPDVGRWIPLLIGLVFLGVFVATREYGLLVAGCIISGVGVGVGLTGVVDDEWSGAAVLLSLAGGFVAIWLISRVLNASDPTWPRGPSRDVVRALWWPLIPGGILALIGVIVLAEEGVGSDVLSWWPLLLIGAGLIIILASRSGRGRVPPGAG